MHIEASTAALRIMVRPMSTLMANLRAVEAEPGPGTSTSGRQQHQEDVSSKVARQQLLRSGTWGARLQRRTPAALEDLMASISPAAAAAAQDEAALRTPAAAEGSAADASTVSLPWCARISGHLGRCRRPCMAHCNGHCQSMQRHANDGLCPAVCSPGSACSWVHAKVVARWKVLKVLILVEGKK